MPLRAVILLFLALCALAPYSAAARVHRRNVGPVILDLGPLPPAPVQPDTPRSSVEPEDTPAVPPVDAPTDSRAPDPQPVEVRPIYPSHTQVLGALVLTLHADIAPVDDTSMSILTSRSSPDCPALVVYYHPTLVEDHALLAPPVETRPPSVDPQTKAEATAGADKKAEPPLPRLRSLVMWIWRLLFLIGLAALFLLVRRHRAGVRKNTALDKEALTVPEIALSRVLRSTRATPATVTDSLSLMTGKPAAIDTPEADSKMFGLIEPGAATPDLTGAETPLVRKRPQRQAPV